MGVGMTKRESRNFLVINQRRLKSIAWADKNAADIECVNQGAISKKEAFIWWALPLHLQHLEEEKE